MAGATEWSAFLGRLDDAAKLAGLDPDTHELLRTPERVLEVAVPVQMDDGRLEVFRGWRVHHNTARGPAKGGLRFHPDLDVDALSALAAAMTLKTALVAPSWILVRFTEFMIVGTLLRVWAGCV